MHGQFQLSTSSEEYGASLIALSQFRANKLLKFAPYEKPTYLYFA